MKLAGVDVISLDGQSNKPHAGRAMNRMMAVFSESQRDDLIATMKQGKMGRARVGKVVSGRYAPMGFVYDADSGNYHVDETRMAHVRRIFRMIGDEGKSMRAVKAAFDREGIRPLGGSRFWRAGSVRRIIQNDVYRPYSCDELKPLISPEVAARLDPDKRYGVAWYKHSHWERNPDADDTAIHVTANGREDWIAVPVPDAGVPRDHVDAARERTKDNVRPARAAGRYWELKGIVYCPCGCRLSPRTAGKYYYYVCTRHSRDGKAACEHGKNWPAEAVEGEVRQFALNLIRNPEVLREDIQAEADRLKEMLRRPERQIRHWADQLAAIERKRADFQDQAAEGLMTLDELRTRLAELEEQRAVAEGELDQLRNTQQQLVYLNDLPDLIEDYLRDLPQLMAAPVRKWDEDGSDGLQIYTVTPDTVQPRPEIDQEAMGRKFQGLYEQLGLKVVKTADGLEVTWDFGQGFSKKCASPRCTASATTS